MNPVAAVTGGAILAIASAAAQQATVLDGVFTAAQAERGAGVYAIHCAACHDGADVDGPPLTGAPFIDRWREDTVGSLFDFLKTEMPQRAPGSLSEAEYLAIVAHLLRENHYPTGAEELTTERVHRTLLIGPDGPQPLPSGALVGVVGCLMRNPAGEWSMARAADPSRVRVGDQISADEARTAAASAPGTRTFALQNVGEGGTAVPPEGHKVLVKGALRQRSGVSGIYVTAAKSVAATCD